MSTMTVDNAKYDEGRQRYTRGDTIRSLIESVEQMRAESENRERNMAVDAPPLPHDHWRKAQDAASSLMLGFADAALGDLRRALSGRGGLRA